MSSAIILLLLFRNICADEGINFALGKPAFQSGTLYGGKPSNAVDGYRNPYYSENSCVHTSNMHQPWWIVHLQEDIFVTSVKITNRADCCWDRLANFNVRVGNIHANGGKINRLCAPPYKQNVGRGRTELITCTTPLQGRYVTVTMTQHVGTLNFCELEVYGYRRTLRKYARWDTLYDSSARWAMPNFLYHLPSEVFLVMVMNEAGHKYYHPSIPVLKTLSGYPSISYSLYWNDAWSLLGYKGRLSNPSWRNSVMKNAGYGPAVIETIIPKLLVPPNPPLDITVVDLTNSSITLSWSRPLGTFTQDVLPLSYTVCLGETGNSNPKCRTVQHGQLYEATGLKAQTKFTVTIKAVSYAGSGPLATLNLATIEKDSYMIRVELVSRIKEDALHRSDGKPYSSITIRGQQQEFRGHGHHFLILDAKTGVQISQRSFDTHNEPDSGKEMAKFLTGIPTKMIILMVVYYQAHDHYNASSSILSTICPHVPSNYLTRQSWSMICLKGHGPMPWVGSKISTARDGPTVLKNQILLPKELRVAPVIQNVSVLGPRSLEFNWSAPTIDRYTGSLLAFQICYRNTDIAGSNCSMVSVDGGKVKTVINDFRPFQEYSVKIRGVVALGYGPYSNAVRQRTPEAEPSTGPSDVRFPRVNSTSIYITWSPPSKLHRNGIIRQYSICYEEESRAKMPCNKTLILSAAETSYEAIGLKPYVRYKFELKAATVIGSGPASIAYYRTSQSAPDGAPIDLRVTHVNSTSISLSWLPPSPDQRNGIIVDYKLCIRFFSTSPGPCKLEMWIGNQTEYTKTNLKPYTAYNFRVSAATVAGLGPSALVVNKTLQAEPSGPPTNLSVVKVNHSHIMVTWSAPVPSDMNGILTQYSVCIIAESDVSCQRPHIIPISQTSYLFSKLAPYSNYTIEVKAATIIGFGPMASVTQRTLPSAPSGPPTMITVEFLNGTVIKFKWSPPEPKLRNGEIVLYSLCIREYGSLFACNRTTNISGSQNYHVYSDLNPTKEYIIRIRAGTVVGLGPSEFLQKTAGECDLPVLHRDGMVSDKSFSASGYLGHNYEPYQARINNELPWCDSGSRQDAYLQVDFGGQLRILGLATQGHRLHWRSWVTSYSVWYSMDSIEWKYVTVVGNKVIRGNIKDGETSVQHFLDEPVVARYVRFKVLTFVGLHKCMRVEILGCAPASSPEKASVAFIDSTSIKVVWSPMPKVTANGRIYGYRICYGKFSSHLKCESSAVVHYGTTSYNIKKLKAYTHYTIKISAGTIAGYGPPLLLKARTNESAPTGPPFVIMAQDVTATTLNLIWSPPEERHRCGIITKYGICYQDSNLRTNCRNITQFSEDKRSHLINDLRPNTKYMLQVKAATKVGWGPPGAVYQTTLSSAPSGPPTSVSVTQLGTTVLQISWFPPAPEKRNGQITGYRVCYTEEPNTAQCENHVSLPEAQTTYSVTGLKPNTIYKVHVEAKTSLGYGPPHVVTHKTGESVPSGPPKDVIVTSVNSTSIEITWNPPEEGKRNGLITGYEVITFRELSGSKIEKLSSSLIPSSITSWSATKLSSKTDYIFHIKAGTSKGFGPSVIIHKSTEGLDAPDTAASKQKQITSAGIAGGTLSIVVIIAGGILSVLWNKGLLPNTRIKRLKLEAERRQRRRRRRRRKRKRRRRRKRRRKEISEIPNVTVHATDSVYSELNDYDAPQSPKSRGEGPPEVTAEDLYDTLGLPQEDIYDSSLIFYQLNASEEVATVERALVRSVQSYSSIDPQKAVLQVVTPSPAPSQLTVQQPTIAPPHIPQPAASRLTVSSKNFPKPTISQVSMLHPRISQQVVPPPTVNGAHTNSIESQSSVDNQAGHQAAIPALATSELKVHQPTIVPPHIPRPAASRLTVSSTNFPKPSISQVSMLHPRISQQVVPPPPVNEAHRNSIESQSSVDNQQAGHQAALPALAASELTVQPSTVSQPHIPPPTISKLTVSKTNLPVPGTSQDSMLHPSAPQQIILSPPSSQTAVPQLAAPSETYIQNHSEKALPKTSIPFPSASQTTFPQRAIPAPTSTISSLTKKTDEI